MALIKCRVCGAKISDKAIKCPKCNTSLVDNEKKELENEVKRLEAILQEQRAKNEKIREEKAKAKITKEVSEIRVSEELPEKNNRVTEDDKSKIGEIDPAKKNNNIVLILGCVVILVGAIVLFLPKGDNSGKEVVANTENKTTTIITTTAPLITTTTPVVTTATKISTTAKPVTTTKLSFKVPTDAIKMNV